MSEIIYTTTSTELTSVADAIRSKGNTSESLEYPDGFVEAIEAIEGGGVEHYILSHYLRVLMPLNL
jgi:hypothetical protein